MVRVSTNDSAKKTETIARKSCIFQTELFSMQMHIPLHASRSNKQMFACARVNYAIPWDPLRTSHLSPLLLNGACMYLCVCMYQWNQFYCAAKQHRTLSKQYEYRLYSNPLWLLFSHLDVRHFFSCIVLNSSVYYWRKNAIKAVIL